MGMPDTVATEILTYMFITTAPAWAANEHVYIALHTADPSAGTQSTSECAYTGYARVELDRDVGAWTVASHVSSNAAQIQFGLCTALTSTATYFSVGELTSGAGKIYFSGQLTSPLAISANITPQFAIGALTVTLT